jgi:hypothetical protein
MGRSAGGIKKVAENNLAPRIQKLGVDQLAYRIGGMEGGLYQVCLEPKVFARGIQGLIEVQVQLFLGQVMHISIERIDDFLEAIVERAGTESEAEYNCCKQKEGITQTGHDQVFGVRYIN